MPKLRFFLSSEPTALAPPTNQLFETDADSPECVANQIRRMGNWHALWLHVLVWSSENDEPREFETIRLERDSEYTVQPARSKCGNTAFGRS
jgi:hypothetical protein